MVRIRREDFSPIENVQTSYGPHSSSYSVGTGVLSQGIKRPGREVDHSPSPSAQFEWSHTSTPLIRLNDVNSEDYTFYLQLS